VMQRLGARSVGELLSFVFATFLAGMLGGSSGTPEQWTFKWDKHSPVQGPYPTATMVKWTKQGYFAQSNEPPLVKLLNKKSDWVPYNSVDFVAYADFMAQSSARANDRVKQASALVELMDGSERNAMLGLIEREDDEQRRLMESAERISPKHYDQGHDGPVLGENKEKTTEFVVTGTVTSGTEDSTSASCTIAEIPDSSTAHTHSGETCPDSYDILKHLEVTDKGGLPLSEQSADDSADSATWWVEHEKRALIQTENAQLRKRQVIAIRPQLGESMSGDAHIAMRHLTISLADLKRDVKVQIKAYRKKLEPQRIMEHPIVSKELNKCLSDPEYDLMRGQNGDVKLAKKVVGALLRQHTWVRKRMMRRATEILSNGRIITEAIISAAAQRYNEQVEHINRSDPGKVKDLGEGSEAEATARTQMQTTEAATMGALKKLKTQGFNVIKTIFRELKHPARKMLSAMACELMNEFRKHRLERRQTVALRTKLQPYRLLTLPTHGERAGEGRLTCADSHPLAKDNKGYGYAGGNNCGALKEKVISVEEALKLSVARNNHTQILFKDVMDSSAWQDKNVRWSQSSPEHQTMTKASYKLLGDQYDMTAPRQNEIAGMKHTYKLLSSCPVTCSSCLQSPESGDVDDCYQDNLRRNYPLPWNSEYKHFSSLTRASPVASGVAILKLTDAGALSPKWPYGWRKQVTRESVSKGGFWNSNTAIGPYVQCGICRVTTCMSNAGGGKLVYFYNKKADRMCSTAELESQDVHDVTANSSPNIEHKTSCVAQSPTSRYCTTSSKAECMYVQYCQRNNWNCDSNSGWSDPIYDCSKVVSNTGITGDEWCSQLAV